jgi:uncharacterized protein
MRRQERELPRAEALRILDEADHGVLATVDASGQPYAVPVNHVRVGGVLYFHGAPLGHKLDNLALNDRFSFCAVTRARVLPAELSTSFESAVAFGRARVVTDPDEKRRALEALLVRFCPDHLPMGERAIEASWERTAVVCLEIAHATAKARD